MDGEVVILGADGTEHVFPAGFDPKRAAGIVRGKQSVVSPTSAGDILSGKVGRDTNLSDSPTEPDWKSNLNEMMQSAAHPETVGDMMGLLIPGQVEGALRTAGMYGRAMKQGMQGRPSGVTGLLSVPTRAYRALKSSFPSEMAKEVEAFTGPKVPTAPPTGPRILTRSPDLLDSALQDARTARATPQPTAPAATTGLSAADRAALVKQGYPADVIAKIEAEATKPVPMASHTSTAPGPEFQPVDVPAARPTSPTPSAWAVSDQPIGLQPGFSRSDVAQAATQMQRENPNIVAEAEQMRQRAALQGPRIQTGAERVGRQVGMTKDAVRQAAGPVLDEAVGDASPILPQAALERIIDDLKQLPRGGPEREAYVARATSGKTKAQVENARRTLEHLGFLVPAAVGVRESLQRLMSSHEPTTGTP